MKVKKQKNKYFLLDLLIFLLVINYMVVTIIFNDNIFLKYLRDIILIVILLSRTKLTNKLNIYEILFGGFLIILIVESFLTGSLNVSITCVRRYVFPLLLLFCCSHLKIDNCDMKHTVTFLSVLLAILGLFGIFQAYVLGDTFLMNLGYPSSYSYAYDTVKLNNSYYFGNLGIQRVVITLSNSNVCALIYGITIIMMFFSLPYLKLRFKKIIFVVLLFVYILTFSRANFLAMIIVCFLYRRYIPYKKQLTYLCFIAVVIAVISFFVQGENGYVAKIISWIVDTFSGTESSSSARVSIWQDALDSVISNPFGIGLGYVGSLGVALGNQDSELYLASENSYLAIASDTGILGLLLYIFALLFIFKKLFTKVRLYKNNNVEYARLCKGAIAVLVYTLIAMFFSNHIYDMEAMSTCYIFVGLALGSNTNISTRNSHLFVNSTLVTK